ncbi:MAG TPA: hypothetical protein PLX36_06180 [Pseudomonadales bacterium]|nr:hypothetical protein [Pseudomonadales bacterium]
MLIDVAQIKLDPLSFNRLRRSCRFGRPKILRMTNPASPKLSKLFDPPIGALARDIAASPASIEHGIVASH